MLKVLFSRVREYWKWTLVTPLFMIGEVAMDVLIPTIMSEIVDVGIATTDVSFIVRMSIRLVLVAMLSLAFGCLGAWAGAIASSGFAKNLRHDEYRKVMGFSFADIDKFSTSSLITRMTTDIQNIQNAFQGMIRMSVRSPIMFIFAFIMVWRNGGSLVAVFAVAIPVVALTVYFCFRYSHKYFEGAFKGYDVFNRVVQENLNGIRTVKAYVREDEQLEKFTDASANIRDNFNKGQKIMAFMNPMVMFVSYMCMIAISYLGAKLIQVGNMQTGDLMSIYTYTGQILMSLTMMGMAITMLSISRPSMERVAEVLTTEPSMDPNENGEVYVPDGSVKFEDVDFGYSEDSSVLSGINLEIPSGSMVGILGSTGSGKSTLVSLIARLYDPLSGRVVVGGLDAKDYNLTALRNQVSVVLQKNTLFTGTVRENLKWGNPDATDEDVKRACDIACASSFLEAMPEGYDSHVDQGGTNFSGGQRQRLCIARALMKNPRILILDDSTSAVDTATDASIRRSLRDDVKGLTKIIIAQRVSTVMEADMIVMMDNGRIADVGTHEELLSRNDAYKDLYYTQTKGDDNNG